MQSTMNDVLASNSPLSRKPRMTRKTVSATWIPRQSRGARKNPRRMLTIQQMPTASPAQPRLHQRGHPAAVEHLLGPRLPDHLNRLLRQPAAEPHVPDGLTGCDGGLPGVEPVGERRETSGILTAGDGLAERRGQHHEAEDERRDGGDDARDQGRIRVANSTRMTRDTAPAAREVRDWVRMMMATHRHEEHGARPVLTAKEAGDHPQHAHDRQ